MPFFKQPNWKRNGLTSLGYNGPVNAAKRTTRKEYFPRAPLFSRLPGVPPTRRNNNRTRAAPVLHNPMENYNRMEAMNQSLYGSSNGGIGSSNGMGSSSGGIAFSNGLGSPIEGLSPITVNSPRGNKTRRGPNRSQRRRTSNSNLAGLRIHIDESPTPSEIRANPKTPSILHNVSRGGISSSGGLTYISPRSGSSLNESI